MNRLVLPTPLGSFTEEIFLCDGDWGTTVVKSKQILTCLELTLMREKMSINQNNEYKRQNVITPLKERNQISNCRESFFKA